MAMDQIDLITSLSPDMDESAQHWLETAQAAATKPPSPFEADRSSDPIHASGTSTLRHMTAHTASTISSNPQHATGSKARIQIHARSSLAALELPPPLSQEDLDSDSNAFEESFARALRTSPRSSSGLDQPRETEQDGGIIWYDGTPDHESNKAGPAFSRSIAAQPGVSSRHAPAVLPPRKRVSITLGPPKKARASLSICLWHEVSHNSQYTRPVKDILREVLEVRYPVHDSDDQIGREEASDAQALLTAVYEGRGGRRK